MIKISNLRQNCGFVFGSELLCQIGTAKVPMHGRTNSTVAQCTSCVSTAQKLVKLERKIAQMCLPCLPCLPRLPCLPCLLAFYISEIWWRRGIWNSNMWPESNTRSQNLCWSFWLSTECRVRTASLKGHQKVIWVIGEYSIIATSLAKKTLKS